jgi:hypothetical protein
MFKKLLTKRNVENLSLARKKFAMNKELSQVSYKRNGYQSLSHCFDIFILEVDSK